MRRAAIGIGSNSMRLLVADVADGRFICVRRNRYGLRPMDEIEAGRFTEEGMARIVSAVMGLQAEALGFGSETVELIATSAARDAANTHALAELLLRETGLGLRVLGGQEEAALSYRGGALPGYCGLIDVGGGSTELAVGLDLELRAGVSLQLGASRLRRTAPPVSPEGAEALVRRIMPQIEEGWACLGQALPSQWVGVGGTATTLAAIDLGRRGPMEGHLLKKEAVEGLLDRMAALTLEQRAEIPGMSGRRTDIIVPGTAIVAACMRVLNIQALVVTERGNLDGCLRGS